MPKRGGYNMGGLLRGFDEQYYSDSYGSHSEGDDEDDGGYERDDRPRRRGTPGWGSRKSGGPWNEWKYWPADLDPIPPGYWRLELGAQRGAPARLLKPLQGSFAHNEQTLSASAAAALKRAKEIFDEYITTVVDPPTIFELIPEHATFTQPFMWRKGKKGDPAEKYRDRYAKIVGDVHSDGYALLFDRGEDDGTVPYIPTSQERFKFGLDSKYVPVHATYADHSFEWDRIEFHLTKDAGAGLEAYVSSWPGCSARPKMLSAEKIAALGFKRKSMRVYGFAVSAEGLRAYRAAKEEGSQTDGAFLFPPPAPPPPAPNPPAPRPAAIAAARAPEKRKNLPTSTFDAKGPIFTSTGRCNLCQCECGAGKKSRITHENGKRHRANLAEDAKRRRTE